MIKLDLEKTSEEEILRVLQEYNLNCRLNHVSELEKSQNHMKSILQV